jgi:replicative DNA helicase
MVNGATALDFAPEPKPIHNIEAEQALLGALLINNQVFWAVEERVDTQHFYDPLHAQIFDAITAMVRAGQQATPVTLKPRFDHQDLVGGLTVPQYLGRLAANAVSLLSAKDYAATIRDLALRRMMLIIGQELVEEAHRDHSITAAEIIERAESRLYEIAERGDRKGPVHVSEALVRAAERLERAVERGDGVTGTATGIHKLDRETGDLMPSNLIVLAGRPAMGKTALGLNIALNVAKAGTPALFFSLEM